MNFDVINHVFYHTVADIRKNVHAFMENMMLEPIKVIEWLCVRMESSAIQENL
nr:hypothetical protein [uncultured Bacillus sp.]